MHPLFVSVLRGWWKLSNEEWLDESNSKIKKEKGHEPRMGTSVLRRKEMEMEKEKGGETRARSEDNHFLPFKNGS